jgi:2,3-dihydroxybiphenyl 1,2-dioxygenase
MAALSNLGYAVFGVSNFDRWEHFAVDLMGFQVGRREDGRVMTLRMDEQEQRLVLEAGNDDDLRVAGWQLDTEDDLLAYVDRLRGLGLQVEECSAAHAHERRVERVFSLDDPNGFRHEFYVGPGVAPISRPFRSSTMKGPGFRTGDLGVGHLLPRCHDYAASIRFYRDVLGLRISDRIREEVEPGRVADATFFHAATGRHHSLATVQIDMPRILTHVMVEVQDMDDVGLAYDRCARAGLTFARELGHHPNDRMFSFYVHTPSGFAMEYGWGGIVVDDATWKVVTYDKMSDWGHKRPQPRA